MVDLYFYRDPEEVSGSIINLAKMLTRPSSFEPVHKIWYLTTFYMGESFQDYSWIQDFEADFRPQNAEPGKLYYLLCLIFSLSKDNWPFKLGTVNI